MSLVEFITYLTGIGAVVVLSWGMERVKWFQSITSEQRRFIQFGGSALLAIIAKLVLTYVPAETLAMIAPYFEIVSVIFAYVVANQYAHKVDKSGQ